MMKRMTNRMSRTGRLLGLLLVFCVGLLPNSVQAMRLSEQEVRRAVQTWVSSVTANARPDAVIQWMEPHQVDGETVAYIAHLAGGGFCLCGADDMVLPVYFYSPRGTYDPENPNYQYILWEIGTRLKNLQEGLQKGDPEFYSYQEDLADREAYWQDLVAGRAPNRLKEPKHPPSEPDSMSLDFTPHWHQGSPYNDQCPELTPGEDEHTLVGDDATAMAQIMYYWRWPYTGEGDGDVEYEYRWSATWIEEALADDPGIPPDSIWEGRLQWIPADSGKLRMRGYWDESLYNDARDINEHPDYRQALEHLWGALTDSSTVCYANFGATDYDWSVIEDTHTDPPDAGDAEVAKLCYHVGIATDMTYGVRRSEASTWDVEDALKNHLRYDHDATFGDRNINTMTEEIQWFRPLALAGCKLDSLGMTWHAWVVYGYNKRSDPYRQFLVNMGWGGEGDGWYTCDSIAYNFWQHHVTRIAPEDVVRFVGGHYPGDGSPGNPYMDIEEAIASAPDSATLIFKAGSEMSFSADTLVIDRPMVLKGKMVIGEQ